MWKAYSFFPPAGSSVSAAMGMGDGRALTRMFVLKLGEIVDILINDDPEAIGFAVR